MDRVTIYLRFCKDIIGYPTNVMEIICNYLGAPSREEILRLSLDGDTQTMTKMSELLRDGNEKVDEEVFNFYQQHYDQDHQDRQCGHQNYNLICILGLLEQKIEQKINFW